MGQPSQPYDRGRKRRLFLRARPSLARLLSTALLIVIPAGASLADTYLLPSPGKASLTKRNWLLQAQRSDLQYRVCGVEWLTTLCPHDPKIRILTGLKVNVCIEWLPDDGWNQGEAESHLGDPDFFVVRWKDNGRYTLVSMTRDGRSVFGGATPEAEQSGNGTWNGVRVSPGDRWERGRDGEYKYSMTFDYHSLPGDDCRVQGLEYQGHFIHRYLGSYHFWKASARDVSVSFPWGVSVNAGGLGNSSEAAWVKQLVNPTSRNGQRHVARWDPPGDIVPRPECCPQPQRVPDPEPPRAVPEHSRIPEATPRGSEIGVQGAFEDLETGISLVNLHILDSEGTVIAENAVIPDGQPFAHLNAIFSIPPSYRQPYVDVIFTATDRAGNFAQDLIRRVMIQDERPQLALSAFPLQGDQLEIRAFPGQFEPLEVEIAVRDGDGLQIDWETVVLQPGTGPSLVALVPVVPCSGAEMNGAINAPDGSTIEIRHDDGSELPPSAHTQADWRSRWSELPAAVLLDLSIDPIAQEAQLTVETAPGGLHRLQTATTGAEWRTIRTFSADGGELALTAPATSPTQLYRLLLGVLPGVSVPCGEDRENIYVNHSKNAVDVTVQVTNGCEGTAELELVRIEEVDGEEEHVAKELFVVAGGTTGATTFTVQPGEGIDLDCIAGGDGTCTYTISVP